jgi:hypothetical protein
MDGTGGQERRTLRFPPVEMSWQDIAGLSDPVVRNLCITQRYHELAVGLRDAGLGRDATWCAFAVWASKTAGATIRGEVLPTRVKALMGANGASESLLRRFNHGIEAWAVQRLSHEHIARTIDSVTADVSKHVGDGNLLVFAELAPLFTALRDACRAAPSTPEQLARAMASTISAIPESDAAKGIAAAFSAYGEAQFSPARRPVLVLQANTLAVAHEQRRLQPAIAGALDAPITDTLKKVIETDVVRHAPVAEARRVLDALVDDVCTVLDATWDTVLTEVIMQLVTATERFDLRRDVPPLAEGMFPPELLDIAGSAAGSAVSQWDRTGGRGAPSGAHDWAVLEERMNFIVNLFRSRQQDAGLFNPPFSDTQLQVLAEGHVPPGPL